MDVLLLGAAAIVLLVLTIWIVWRPGSSDTASNPQEGASEATLAADPRVAVAQTVTTPPLPADTAQTVTTPPWPADTVQTVTTPPWPEDTVHAAGTDGSAADREPIRRTAADDATRRRVTPTRIGLGAAVLLLLAGGAIGGAWYYARIQRERNKPLNRLRRRFG